jgi:hypothetical protein
VISRLVRGPPSSGIGASTIDSPRRFDAPIFGLAGAVAVVLGCTLVLALVAIITFTFAATAPDLSAGDVIPPLVLALALWLWMCVVLSRSRMLRKHQRFLFHPVRSLFPRRLAAIWVLGSTALLIAPVLASVVSRLADQSRPIREYDPAQRGYVLSNKATMSAIYRTTDLHAATVQDRFVLSAALAVALIATTVAALDLLRRRRPAKAECSSRPFLSQRYILPPLSASLVLFILGATLAAVTGIASASRLATYFDDAKPLSGRGTVSTFLPAGQETVFVGCSEAISCPPLLANEVDVREGSAAPLLTFADPSHDRLTQNAQPFAGAVSFTVPRSGRYVISTSGGRGWRLRLAAGEGQEARSLAAWVLAASVGLLLVVAELIGLLRYARVSHLARRASSLP